MSALALSTDFVIRVALILHQANQSYILPRFCRLSDDDVKQKSSASDYVTSADIEAEAYIIDELRALTPHASFLAEEQAYNGQLPKHCPSGLVWTVDPLDGTRNFVSERKEFCSMLGLLHDGNPIASWIYRSHEQDCLVSSAQDGLGWVRADSYISITSPSPKKGDFLSLRGTANAMGLAEPQRTIARQKLKLHQGRYHIGSAGLDAVHAALGLSQFVMHSKLTPWDSVPAALTCKAAGFRVALAPHKAEFTPLSVGTLIMAQDNHIWDQVSEFVFS